MVAAVGSSPVHTDPETDERIDRRGRFSACLRKEALDAGATGAVARAQQNKGDAVQATPEPDLHEQQTRRARLC